MYNKKYIFKMRYLWIFDAKMKEMDIRFHIYEITKCWKNKTTLQKCERVKYVKMTIRRIYQNENERQPNLNSTYAFASAAEREIIFISFRTSEIISPIVPSLLFDSFSSLLASTESRARIIRYRVGPSLMN